MSKHPIVHIEISTLDRLASGHFYEKLFGWHIQQMDEMKTTPWRRPTATSSVWASAR